MHFLLVITAALGLGAGTLASPAPASDSLNARAYHWHGCGSVGECHSDADCRNDQDCVNMALGIETNVHCGQSNYPYACWAEWND
ncbi:hypothetical protein BO71DRAFT_479850 [Aspergillus ellipticus CBS 707.79]|uniref:Uncharacterized protein n=1 Tax=Aspergillus ellipticus CBS 707.79 TaxID=1448320 RepID=A0A319DNY3_9EURO|nr:hypothetical protein BO71DRAFT_479850 [Aspergillus ellipticus CBS 707.79]